MGATEQNQVIFAIAREDVLNCAREMGLPDEALTDELLEQVKKGVEWGLIGWDEVVKEALNFALKN